MREEVSLVQTAIPYTTTYVADPNTELEQNSVVTAGQYGIQVARVRVRYEDGQQVSQKTDSAWVAKEPVAEELGYGTKVVVRTLDTPNGPIQYWRAITVYATSYSPCRSAASRLLSRHIQRPASAEGRHRRDPLLVQLDGRPAALRARLRRRNHR